MDKFINEDKVIPLYLAQALDGLVNRDSLLYRGQNDDNEFGTLSYFINQKDFDDNYERKLLGVASYSDIEIDNYTDWYYAYNSDELFDMLRWEDNEYYIEMNYNHVFDSRVVRLYSGVDKNLIHGEEGEYPAEALGLMLLYVAVRNLLVIKEY